MTGYNSDRDSFCRLIKIAFSRSDILSIDLGFFTVIWKCNISDTRRGSEGGERKRRNQSLVVSLWRDPISKVVGGERKISRVLAHSVGLVSAYVVT